MPPPPLVELRCPALPTLLYLDDAGRSVRCWQVSAMLAAAGAPSPDADAHAAYCGQLDKICVALVSQHLWRLELERDRPSSDG